MMSLIAGNGVVLKPSEVTPLMALKARELYLAADLPPELFQVVTGRGAAGAHAAATLRPVATEPVKMQ